MIDPSGYVYDVDTNERLEGVTATAYCVEYDESEGFWDEAPSADEYGTLWDAAEYEQSNPLLTDFEGRYAWDVPEGWWRVKYEKEGYETTWSDWMTVPPVQTEVNIGMKAIPTVSFTDVPEKAYYAKAVAWAVKNGVTTGTSDTTFSPNKTCTRGQVVTFLWRTAGSPKPTQTTHSFTDVKASAYYYTAMLWAVENGITTGTSETTFGPNKNCTRVQVVTFLWRFFGCPETMLTESPFTDVKAANLPAVLWAVENGITTGTSATTFSPKKACTRAQVVTFLWRAVMNLNGAVS